MKTTGMLVSTWRDVVTPAPATSRTSTIRAHMDMDRRMFTSTPTIWSESAGMEGVQVDNCVRGHKAIGVRNRCHSPKVA